MGVSEHIFWLVLTVMMSSLFWLPYIVNRILENGLWEALRNPNPDVAPKAQWADRMKHAHSNAIENLMIFAPLVLCLEVIGFKNDMTILACQCYFFARLAHYVIYSFGLPLLRTVAFFIGALAQWVLGYSILCQI